MNMNSAAGVSGNEMYYNYNVTVSAVVELLQVCASKIADPETWMQLLGFNTVEDTC